MIVREGRHTRQVTCLSVAVHRLPSLWSPATMRPPIHGDERHVAFEINLANCEQVDDDQGERPYWIHVQFGNEVRRKVVKTGLLAVPKLVAGRTTKREHALRLRRLTVHEKPDVAQVEIRVELMAPHPMDEQIRLIFEL